MKNHSGRWDDVRSNRTVIRARGVSRKKGLSGEAVGAAKRGGSREVQYSGVYRANLAIRSVMIISHWDMLGVDTERFVCTSGCTSTEFDDDDEIAVRP